MKIDPKIRASWRIVLNEAHARHLAVRVTVAATSAAEAAVEKERLALRRYVDLVYRLTGINLDDEDGGDPTDLAPSKLARRLAVQS